MIPEKGQRTGVVRVVIHNSDQLISHLCLRGKTKRVREKELKKINQKTRANREREEVSYVPISSLTRRRNKRDDRGKRVI